MSQPPWEFWIDVGGTFTDCLARDPVGGLHRRKVLSSGVVRGRGTFDGQAVMQDEGIAGDADNTWRGYDLRLRSGRKVVGETSVETSAAGRLVCQPTLPALASGTYDYELWTDEEAPIVAIRRILGLSRHDSIPSIRVRLGTTRGTNALLTRRGATVAFITTRGFGDIPRIAYQSRPKLFELGIRKPEPLFAYVVEIDERIGVDGSVLVPLDEQTIRRQLETLKHKGIDSVAINLLNAYRHPEHEKEVGRIAESVFHVPVSLSHEAVPLIKLVDRGDTTLVDAYLNPVLQEYLERLGRALGENNRGNLRLLSSAGGLIPADRFSGKDSILSGPAGGVVGCARVAEGAGFAKAIGFDMGGTSTDVSRYDGQFDLQYETVKAGVRIAAPMMAIETVAAGGGSLCDFDGVKLVVGPNSAGADPGPACYGRGGPLTVTDVNLFLGRIPASQFPFPLDSQAVQQRLAELCDRIAEAGTSYRWSELAEGLLQVANANMAEAIRTISLAQGYDPREYVLCSFGGAAGQHACAVAEILGIRHVLIHPDAGILSAYGIGLADVVRHRAEGIYRPLDGIDRDEIVRTVQRLSRLARDEVTAEGIADEAVTVTAALELRFIGVDAALHLDFVDEIPIEAFHREHQRRFGYTTIDRPLELVTIRVQAVGRSPDQPSESRSLPPVPARPEESAQLVTLGGEIEAPLFHREKLVAGSRLEGPAIVAEARATTVVDAGWSAEIYSGGELVLTCHGESSIQRPTIPMEAPAPADPILLELFNQRFAAIAEQMGVTLRKTSSSVNVKERLDFSCAVFTAEGDLVVNAPHIPVHLGAMAETVRSIIRDNPVIAPGDVFVTNDPYRGGSHLPDITVVTPVGGPDEDTDLRFFTASRAHHAEIGGIRPGSMPPFSTTLADEGVLIQNFKVVSQQQHRFEALEDLLSRGEHPSRAVRDNLADIAAQMAANQQGARDLHQLTERYGWPTVAAYMSHIQSAAATKANNALKKLPGGRRQFVDQLDCGAQIAVAVEVRSGRLSIDFNGTDDVLPGNLNANPAIVTAAILYCLRCLIDEDIPLNQGVLEPVDLVLPQSLLNPKPNPQPSQSPAVVGGNVETSQRVVDVLLAAFELAAASQGTMNNFLFGDETFGYYETICGGEGATPQRDGADAVHTHMTNTRITDPEIMEFRYPVRVLEFSIRRGSGGRGKHCGGSGVNRHLEFLQTLDVSILSSRRTCRPFGLADGEPGMAGRNVLIRSDGTELELESSAQLRVEAGDQVRIETPGGGGFGSPK